MARRLPERGQIAVFDRSWYGRVLVERVEGFCTEAEWKRAYREINEMEEQLAGFGTVIIKFFLNVSREEQKQRFLSRLDEPDKNWKFEPKDVVERRFWDDYMAAYEAAMNATSRPWAPWYAVPADDKPMMRLTVARLLVQSLERLGLRYPELGDAERARFDEMRRLLESDG